MQNHFNRDIQDNQDKSENSGLDNNEIILYILFIPVNSRFAVFSTYLCVLCG